MGCMWIGFDCCDAGLQEKYLCGLDLTCCDAAEVNARSLKVKLGSKGANPISC